MKDKMYNELPVAPLHKTRGATVVFYRKYKRVLFFLVLIYSADHFFSAFSILVNPKYSSRSVLGITYDFYNPFIDRYFNLFRGFTKFVLHGSKIMVEQLGYSAVLNRFNNIQINNGHQVNLYTVCLGLDFITFWFAFVLSNKGRWFYKSVWMIAGIFFLLLVNMCRISLLLIANEEHFIQRIPIEHHTLFNIGSYVVLAVFLLLYIRSMMGSRRESIAN